MIHDLGIIMLVAGVISILCKYLKQPVVLGYIVAGLLAGPYVVGSSWVDVKSAETWGEVGVIFLLFTLGLEFSFKKLVSIGATAFIGCATIVTGMMTTGFLLGQLMGWDNMNSLFLGGMLCMSSTTIVFKALDDLGMRQQPFAGVCFGILVVEDLFAVVLMVLLASIAVKQQFDGQEMLWQVSKLAGYLLIWFVVGIFVIPYIFRKFKRFLNDETMTIVSLGLCLGMVLLSEAAGFSAALGAFVMGSILAETLEAERIERLMSPIKNLFGAIFFVSVGMMINPATLGTYWWQITLITIVVIAGQVVFASLGIVLSGKPLKLAMQSAFALTQVGEFAFIIAQFGDSLGVTQKSLYPVIVAVSVITTFLTPYTIKLSAPAYLWVLRKMPPRVQLLLDRWYAMSAPAEDKQKSIWQQFLRVVGITMLIYAVVIFFIMTFYLQLASDLIVGTVNSVLPETWGWIGKLIALALLLLILSPFIYKFVIKHWAAPSRVRMWNDSLFHRAPLVGIFLGRFVLGVLVVVFCIAQYFSLTTGVLLLVGAVVLVAIFATSRIKTQAQSIEDQFLGNLRARENDAAAPKVAAAKVGKTSVTLGRLELSERMPFCGLPLAESNLRQLTQCNVVGIEHNGHLIMNPTPRTMLQAGDILVVAGEPTAVQKMMETWK